MGDRGNIVVQEGAGAEGEPPREVWLYSHWAGSELPRIAQEGLRRAKAAPHSGPNGSLDDASYLGRILFCQMLMDGSPELSTAVMDTSGFGIASQQGDGGTEVYIDVAAQTVTIGEKKRTVEEFLIADLEADEG